MGLGFIVCVKTVNIGPLGFKGYPFFDQRRLGNQSGDRSCEVYAAKQDGRSSVPEHDAQFLGRTMVEAAAVSHPASKLHSRRSAASVEPKNGTACSLRRAAKPKSLCAHACTKVKGQSVETRRVHSFLPQIIGLCRHTVVVECLETFHTALVADRNRAQIHSA